MIGLVCSLQGDYMYASLYKAIVGLYNVQDIEVYMQFFVPPLHTMFLKYGI